MPGTRWQCCQQLCMVSFNWGSLQQMFPTHLLMNGPGSCLQQGLWCWMDSLWKWTKTCCYILSSSTQQFGDRFVLYKCTTIPYSSHIPTRVNMGIWSFVLWFYWWLSSHIPPCAITIIISIGVWEDGTRKHAHTWGDCHSKWAAAFVYLCVSIMTPQQHLVSNV